MVKWDIPEKTHFAYILNFRKRVFSKTPYSVQRPPLLVILWVCLLLSCSPLWGSVVWTVSNIANFSSISILFSKFSHSRVKMTFCFNLSSFCTFLILWRGGSVSHCNLLACSSLVKITLNSRKGKLTFKVIMDMIFATANFWKLHSVMGGFVKMNFQISYDHNPSYSISRWVQSETYWHRRCS